MKRFFFNPTGLITDDENEVSDFLTENEVNSTSLSVLSIKLN